LVELLVANAQFNELGLMEHRELAVNEVSVLEIEVAASHWYW
jgi:hypothetical protein